MCANNGPRAIEDGFPFEVVSKIAEVESWRKELYRPIYHVHKWWAQRLGSVFRAAILAAGSPAGAPIETLFCQRVELPGIVVYDPFMGSGTVVGEAHKLGCAAIGRDINPVAYRSVRVALGPVGRREVEELYAHLEATVGKEIQALYRSHDSSGNPCDVLYFFWVKTVPCPACGNRVELFSNYVFARHACARKNPEARILCPCCGDILIGRYDSTEIRCESCGLRFNPQRGPARRSTAVCPGCSSEFPIARTIRALGGPPEHGCYAKLVLRGDRAKEYLRATDEDWAAFEAAKERLHAIGPPVPRVKIRDGYNTRQIINYGYKTWDQLFNARQLLALTLLGSAIRDLPHGPAREALALLFSGVLEFNNMFASYKGEGTGAVRHMFSHHILKPERTPIEANVWGTPKSSGSFSTLYRTRLLRALRYREAPFEIAVLEQGRRKRGRKVFGLSAPMGGHLLDHYPGGGMPAGAIYLSCGDSSHTDLPSGSVDLVVTDPPFFDNVHYSELADFFYVWQELYFNERSARVYADPDYTTRADAEVQDTDPGRFAGKLARVLTECHRVLKDQGLLVFSYHHSREDGWLALARAVVKAGFSIVQSQPVKSEMSVATPKRLSREPIDIDVLLVCRKRAVDARRRVDAGRALQKALDRARRVVTRFKAVGRDLSKGDTRVVVMSHLLVELCAGRTVEQLLADLDALLPQTRTAISRIWRNQTRQAGTEHPHEQAARAQGQLLLFTSQGGTGA